MDPEVSAEILPEPVKAKQHALPVAEREALVLHESHGTTRWTYDELWGHALAVARALLAIGIGRSGRVGILMSNRPEWVASRPLLR